MEVVIDTETRKELDSFSNLLNGQLRGTINTKAREENLSLIQMTLYEVFRRAVSQGYQIGTSEALEKKVGDELIEKIKKGLQE